MKGIENEFKFLDTPKFNYEYGDETQVLGRKLIHIGEGIFMFEEPFDSEGLSWAQFEEKIEDYKDISFIRFYTLTDNEDDDEERRSFIRSNEKRVLGTPLIDGKDKWIIPFAISATHRRHSNETIDKCVINHMSGFNIPDSMKRIIDNVLENYIEGNHQRRGSEEICCTDTSWGGIYRLAEDECTHLLDFKHNAGDGRYVFVDGFVGRKILDGIYYFDYDVSFTDDEADGRTNSIRDRLSSDNSRMVDYDDFKENIAFIGREMSIEGFFAEVDANIYYMALGDNAVNVLRKLYKYLSGYTMFFEYSRKVGRRSKIQGQLCGEFGEKENETAACLILRRKPPTEGMTLKPPLWQVLKPGVQ